MTPFHPDLENDPGHALDQDDLIAFHLHELSSPEERALHRVLHTNPALQAESLAIAATLRAFPKHEPSLPLDAAALDRHWLALRNSLPLLTPAAIPTRNLFPRSFFPRWAFPALAATAVAASALILVLHHTPPNAPTTVATTASPTRTVPPKNSVPPNTVVPPATSVLFVSAVPPVTAVPPNRPQLTASTCHPLFPTNPTPQPLQPSTALPPTLLQPSANQPITPPPTAAAPSNTTLAAVQQPQPQSSPTFTPIIQSHARARARTHHDHTTDITLAALANLTSARSFTSTTGTSSIPYSQTTSPTFGELASFHQQLRPWLGYRITAAHSQPSFQYNYSPTPTSSAGIVVSEHAYELSATYVVQGPHHRRISTSAEAGGGVIDFHPTNPNATLGVSNSLRPAAVLGISAELALTAHLALHAGYRALLYKSPPAYLTYGLNIPTSGNLTLSSEPVLGLTYRFHEARQ